MTGIHYNNIIRKRQCFLSVVRHHHRCHAGSLLNRPELFADRSPRPGVERRQRFIQKQQTRMWRQSPRNCHALLLTAGELGRITLGQIGEIRQFQHLVQARGKRCFGRFPCPQSVKDVFFDRKIWKKCVILKHNADAALFNRRVRHIVSVNQNATGSGLFQSGNQHQRRALAATRRSQNGRKTPCRNVERRFVKCRLFTVLFGEGLELQIGGFAFGHTCHILFLSEWQAHTSAPESHLCPLQRGQNPSAGNARQSVCPLRC